MTRCPPGDIPLPSGQWTWCALSLSGRACLVLAVTHQRPGEHCLGREYILGAMGD